jgi:6-pyruvoyltetrahydropterin/6-carboxytetrahydropterin synthase
MSNRSIPLQPTVPKLHFRVTKELKWEAAHVLKGLAPNHPCSRMHGHSYRAEVTLSGIPDEVGMVLDFNILKDAIKVRLDHQTLNEVMGDLNPTAENIAVYIMTMVNQILLRAGAQDEVKCERVKVWETETCSAEVWFE